MLTYHQAKADNVPAAAKSVAEFGDSNTKGGHTAIRAVFLCLEYGKPCYGRAIRETFGSAGFLWAGSPTRMVSPTLSGVGNSTQVEEPYYAH